MPEGVVRPGPVPPRPTVRDVARRAGVSVATVSYVLTGARPVAAETRARIRRAMRDLGYEPNRLAQGLARNRVDTVAAVLPVRAQGADPLFAEFVRGAAEGAHGRGFHLLVASEANLPEADAYAGLVRGAAAAGLIVTSIRWQDPRVDALQAQGVPTVLFGHAPEHPEVPWVDIDNVGAVRAAVAHLVDVGCRRIAFLGGPPGFVFADDRRCGYILGLADAGLTPDPRLVREGELDEAEGERLAAEILATGPVDGLVAGSDRMAVGALRALRRHGLEPGGDVALVGFDDSPLAQAADPPLTSLAQPLDVAGRRAAEVLVDLLCGGGAPAATVLSARLRVRASSTAWRRARAR
jgi:DNA-binding LacI/PurR family transcriptional regulator